MYGRPAWIFGCFFIYIFHYSIKKCVFCLAKRVAPVKKKLLLLQNFLHSADLPIHQADLDPMWMISGVGQYIFDNAFSQLAVALIILQYDRDFQAGFDITSFASIHKVIVSGIAG